MQRTPAASGGMLCCFSSKGQSSSFSDLTSPPDGYQGQGVEMTSTSGREAGVGGRWQIIWNKDGVTQRMVFEASGAT